MNIVGIRRLRIGNKFPPRYYIKILSQQEYIYFLVEKYKGDDIYSLKEIEESRYYNTKDSYDITSNSFVEKDAWVYVAIKRFIRRRKIEQIKNLKEI